MAKYKDKWKTTFPTSIGNQTRPEDGVDNTQEYNTDGLPQYMANDPVRYDLQNAVNSQLVSNDERLNEKIKRTSDDLAAHNKDPKAHATGIAGNAATASKLASPRTLSLTGKAAGSATFDGSANAAINVTSVNADTASKLSTARKINITGNATGAAAFDGSGDISINTTVNESKHAAAATTVNATAPNGGAADLVFGTMAVDDYARVRVGGSDDNGWLEIATADAGNEPIYVRQYAGSYDWPNGRPGIVINEAAILDGNGNTKFPKNVTAASFTGPLNGNATSATTAGNVSNNIFYSSDATNIGCGNKLLVVKRAKAGVDNVPNNGLVLQTGANDSYNGQLYITDNGMDGVWVNGWAGGKRGDWTRLVENKGSWNINAATATKLQTPRTISLTGNASGSANFDGSGNISINTTVNNADTVDGVHAGSMYYNKGNWTADNWATMGTYQVNNNAPNSNWYTWGQVISSSTADARFQLYASHQYGGDGRLYYRTGWGSDKSQPWNTILDSENYNNFAPTKTGSGASGTWPISISGNADTVDGYHASDLLSKIYPVGSIYMSMSATNPATLFGVGTWTRISQGRMLLGADDSTYKAGATGGEATHTLTAAEMPAHSHGISTSGDHSHYFYGSDNNNGPLTEGDGLDTEGNGHSTRNVRFATSSAGAHTHTISNSGGGAAHNNMPPYLVCYIWQRTA